MARLRQKEAGPSRIWIFWGARKKGLKVCLLFRLTVGGREGILIYLAALFLISLSGLLREGNVTRTTREVYHGEKDRSFKDSIKASINTEFNNHSTVIKRKGWETEVLSDGGNCHKVVNKLCSWEHWAANSFEAKVPPITGTLKLTRIFLRIWSFCHHRNDFPTIIPRTGPIRYFLFQTIIKLTWRWQFCNMTMPN